jgi:hypothetical protein
LQRRFKIFFSAILLTTAFPYIPFIFPFIPNQIFGLNLTGWAWVMMLLVTLINLLYTKNITFPFKFWVPWILYIAVYLVFDFSYLGLQLTLQYILPLLIGSVASGFLYETKDLEWIFKWLKKLLIAIFIMFVYGYFFHHGYGPGSATAVMLFSFAVSLLAAFYFMTKQLKYLWYIGILFLVPVFEVTKMGIAATATVFIFHFANKKITGKIIFGAVGALVLLLVFNTKRFQEETFQKGKGDLSDLSLDYYNNSKIKTSGRTTWKKALEPGLKAAPVWGNGPRSDNAYLIKITGLKSGEPHNDYLAVRFNYGYVGLTLLLFGFVTSFISLYRISVRYSKNAYIWLLSTSSLTLFISFLMFMYSDNILKYTIYFPNYFFGMMGIVYSLKKDEDHSSYPVIQ